MRILITGAGGPAGVALIKQLAPLGHVVHGVDMQAVDNPGLSFFDTVPAASDPAMVQQLKRHIIQHNIDVLIPTVADELPTIAHAREQLAPATVVIGSAPAVDIAFDKYLTMQHLSAAGVFVPRFALPSEFDTASAALNAFGGQLVLKPRVGRGGRGFRVVTSTDDVDWSTLDDALIIQEFAPGTEYAPMVFTSSRTDQTTVVVVEKTANKPGVTERVASESMPDVAALAADTARAMGLTGPVDIDVRINAAGQPVVLEVNARFGANSEQAPELLAGVLQDMSELVP